MQESTPAIFHNPLLAPQLTAPTGGSKGRSNSLAVGPHGLASPSALWPSGHVNRNRRRARGLASKPFAYAGVTNIRVRDCEADLREFASHELLAPRSFGSEALITRGHSGANRQWLSVAQY